MPPLGGVLIATLTVDSPGFWPGYVAVSLKVYSTPACRTLTRTARLGWLAPVVVTDESVRSSVAPLLSTQLHARSKAVVVRYGALARLTVLLRRIWLGLESRLGSGLGLGMRLGLGLGLGLG